MIARERERDEIQVQDQKIRRKLASRIFWEEVLFFVIGTVLGYLLISTITPWFYEKKDKERIRILEKLSQEYLQSKNFKLYNGVQEEIGKIKKKYPTPISPLLTLFPKFYGSQKPIYLALSFLPLLVGFGSYFLFRLYLRKIDAFFYSVAEKEPPLNIQKEIKYSFFLYNAEKSEERKELLQKTFKKPQELVVIMNGSLARDFDEKLARKIITETISKVLEHAREFYPFISEKEYAFYLEVMLWHYVVFLNGNIPTGLMAVYIKSHTLKRMLSLYQRGLLPLLYRYGEVDKEEFKAYVYLRCFYEADERFSLLDKFKVLDPLAA